MIENTQRTYAIIGTGAVGGWYGAQLQQAGFDVHFLCHSSYEPISKYGLQLQSKDTNTSVRVKAYQDVKEMPACDVVLVTLKTAQNKLLPQLLPPLLKKQSIIIMMQNGLGNEEDAAACAPNHPIICATTSIGATKTAPHIISCNHFSMTRLAAYSASTTEEMLKGIAADFAQAHILVNVYEDYLLIRWQKLLWNIPFNGLSVIYHTDTKQLLNQHFDEIVALAQEVQRIAAAYGKEISQEALKNMLEFTKTLGPYKTSMLMDYEHSRPLELTYFYERPLAAAKAKQVACPHMENLYQQLKALG